MPGASARKLGLLRTATGGTVCLGEMGDVPLATQVKLLRRTSQVSPALGLA